MTKDAMTNAFEIMDAAIELNTKIDILAAALGMCRKSPHVKAWFLAALSVSEGAKD